MTSTTHPTDLQLSMHVDAGLPADDAIVVAEHLVSCTVCQQKIAAMSNEIVLISTALKTETAAEVEALVVPKFSRPASLRGFAMANIATGLTIWLAQFLWKTLFGELVMNAAGWFTSVYVPDIYEVTSTAALYYLQEGTAMFDAYLGLIVLSLSTVTVVWLLLLYRKSRVMMSLCMLMLTMVVIVPVPVNALEVRQDEGVVTVAASETIDDTLVVAAETVIFKGNVTGDLIAVGRRIDIDGSVAGNVITFGESITIRGSVGGMVLGGGSTVDLAGAIVGGNLWAAGEKISVDSDARVARNATVAGQSAVVEGSVVKDLHSFAEILELNGELGEDLEAFGNRVRLLDEAHVGGDARLHIPSEDRLHRAPGARVDGEVEFLDMPEEFEPTNRYASIEFYLWQTARLVSALLVGLALLWLIPGFRNVSVGGGVEGLKTAGIGLVTLIGLPIAAVIVAITLVGLPFTFIGIITWLLFIYLAKIVVGVFVGRMMLASTKHQDSDALVLLAGIATVIIAANLPVIGGFLSFLLTVIGIGMIVQRLVAANSARAQG
jgi:hypothetical protein